jgi:hypothetical protein
MINQANTIRAKLFDRTVLLIERDGILYADASDVFASIFCVGRQKYNLLRKLESGHGEPIQKGSSRYYDLSAINAVLLSFEVQSNSLYKNPDDYANFCTFFESGGMNWFLSDNDIECDSEYEIRDVSVLIEFYESRISGERVSASGDDPNTEFYEKQQERKEDFALRDDADSEEQPGNGQEQPAETPEPVPAKAEIITIAVDAQGMPYAPAKCEMPVIAYASVKRAETPEKAAKIESEISALSSMLKSVLDIQEKADNAMRVLSEKQALMQADMSKVQSEPVQVREVDANEAIDPLREKLMNNRIWLRIAIAVTCIFMPFTVSGLYKYINLGADGNWFVQALVLLLCIAIAAVWDSAIFLFSINGKHNLAMYGTMVQVVFFSAKFDLIKILASDCGYDGDYWQKMLVIFCAVTYSPLLLSHVASLAASNRE